MKNIGLFLMVLVSLVIYSCKNSKEGTTDSKNNTTQVQPNDSIFKVSLEVLAKKDDNFCLFYTTDGSTDFTQIEPIWTDVKGNENFQTIEYKLPKGVKPTQLRLDFGIKKEQPDVVLNKVVLSYNGKEKLIGLAGLGNYFHQDDSKCTFDPNTGVMKAITKDGERKFPSLYPHEENLGPVIQELFQ